MSQAGLPSGKWKMYGNEEQGELDIFSVDALGNLEGTVFGDRISGRFHTPSGTLYFLRLLSTPPPLASSDVLASDQYVFQVYNGHVSIVAQNVDYPQYLLAGS